MAGKDSVSQRGSNVCSCDYSFPFHPRSTQATHNKQQRTPTDGCYRRDGEEERADKVPSPQTGAVSLEGEAALIGLDDTLQRDASEYR